MTLDECNSSDQAEHYHTVTPKLGALFSDPECGLSWSKDFFYNWLLVNAVESLHVLYPHHWVFGP